MILIRRPWARQPQVATQPRSDWCVAFNLATGPADLARSGARLGPPPAGGYYPGRAGVGLNFATTDVSTTSAALAPGLGSAMTAVMLYTPTATTLANNFMFGEQQPGVGAYNWGFYESAGGFLYAFVYTSSGVAALTDFTASALLGTPVCAVMTYDGATIRVYVDGALRVEAAQSGAIQRNASATLGFDSWNTGGCACLLHGAAVSQRAFSTAEIALKFPTVRDAWNSIFLPQQIIIPSAPAGVATPNLTDASAINITSTSARARVTFTR